MKTEALPPLDLGVSLILKSVVDESYRVRLLGAPEVVIAAETGVRLPDGLELIVIEDSPDTLQIVLPTGPTTVVPDHQLAEELRNIRNDDSDGGTCDDGCPPVTTDLTYCSEDVEELKQEVVKLKQRVDELERKVGP